jgi:Xaa-Pro dipeptidase
MGDHTLFVPNALFIENRRRLCQRLRANTSVPQNAFVVLQGGESLGLYDTDVEYIFRQVGVTTLRGYKFACGSIWM